MFIIDSYATTDKELLVRYCPLAGAVNSMGATETTNENKGELGLVVR